MAGRTPDDLDRLIVERDDAGRALPDRRRTPRCHNPCVSTRHARISSAITLADPEQPAEQRLDSQQLEEAG